MILKFEIQYQGTDIIEIISFLPVFHCCCLFDVCVCVVLNVRCYYKAQQSWNYDIAKAPLKLMMFHPPKC